MFSASSLLAALANGLCVSAAVYNWDVTWVNRNPDGLHERPVIGLNNQWPLPAITANVGEQITVHLTNQLGNETTGLHFHGLFQNGTNSMDGPTGVTQCPIGPGETFTQTFTVSTTPRAAFKRPKADIQNRSTSLALIGIILTTRANTLTVSEAQS